MNEPRALGRGGSGPTGTAGMEVGELSAEHCFLVLRHRKWFILAVFLIVSCGTGVVSYLLPNVYTSETLILVDPQQVPTEYVKPTVSGDVRDRLGTLSQQILSVTRLQIIIDTFNLYSEERSQQAQEEVINQMRQDVTIELIEDQNANRYREQGLQAFRITYSGKEPRVVAQVTNQLASLFIEENLKARERVATGTAEFIENQLAVTERKLLELEAQLRDFKLQHAGEMPDQQATNLQILGQLQARLQMVVDAQNRAEQQKSYLQAILATLPVPADTSETAETAEADDGQAPDSEEEELPNPDLIQDERMLAALRSRYGAQHPDVVRLEREIEETREIKEKEAKAEQEIRAARLTETLAQAPGPRREAPVPPLSGGQPIEPLRVQLTALDAEIANQKNQQGRVLQRIDTYQQRVEAVPIREQEIADLVRDYEMTKSHYGDLLSKGISARQATQLEVLQKGERFTILDPAQVPETPSRPNRIRINVLGSAGGLALGIVLVLVTELLGFSITQPQQIFAATGIPVLGVIPNIFTHADRLQRRRRAIAGAATGLTVLLAVGALLAYHYRTQIF